MSICLPFGLFCYQVLETIQIKKKGWCTTVQVFGSTTIAKTGSDQFFSWRRLQAVSVVQSSDRSDNL